MEIKSSLLKRMMPVILIVFGFLSLSRIEPMIGFGSIFLGIVMFIERKWPEKWGEITSK